jgi:heat shock protein HslJ
MMVVSIAVLAMACDETPTAPSRLDLSGRWVVSSMQPVSGVEIVPRSGVALALEFADDRVAVQSDCNICSGRYALAGDALTFSLLACTRRACLQDSYESTFLDLVSSVETAGLAPGRVLILTGRNGRILLRR